MLTKIMAAILALFIAGIVSFSGSPTEVTAQELTALPVAIPSGDSSVKKAVDSTKCIREEFVAQKESIKDKFQILIEQQKRIRQNQRSIDSTLISQSLNDR